MPTTILLVLILLFNPVQAKVNKMTFDFSNPEDFYILPQGQFFGAASPARKLSSKISITVHNFPEASQTLRVSTVSSDNHYADFVTNKNATQQEYSIRNDSTTIKLVLGSIRNTDETVTFKLEALDPDDQLLGSSFFNTIIPVSERVVCTGAIDNSCYKIVFDEQDPFYSGGLGCPFSLGLEIVDDSFCEAN